MNVVREESRVVVEHLLEVRDDPPRVRRVPMEPASDLVIDAPSGHGGQGARDDRPQALLPRAAVAGHDPLHRPGMGELLLSRDASVDGVELASKGVRAFLQHRLVRDAFFHEGFPALREGLVERIRLPQRVRAVRPVVFGHREEHPTESRPTVGVLRREVRPAVEGLPVGREEPRERPSSLTRDGADRLLVPGVDVGPLVSVDLDRDEMFVDDLRQFRVLVGLAVDHMAPVAPRGPDVQEDRPIELLGTPERLLAPRIPVDRLVRRSLEVGGGLLREAIGTVLRHPTDACARSLWPFGTRPRDHFR